MRCVPDQARLLPACTAGHAAAPGLKHRALSISALHLLAIAVTTGTRSGRHTSCGRSLVKGQPTGMVSKAECEAGLDTWLWRTRLLQIAVDKVVDFRSIQRHLL